MPYLILTIIVIVLTIISSIAVIGATISCIVAYTKRQRHLYLFLLFAAATASLILAATSGFLSQLQALTEKI